MGVLLVVLLAETAGASVAAAPAIPSRGSCTGWFSRETPPDTIRVLRTATGRVETVHFPTYVVTVMASGEWPTTMPPAALEVGATAVKQYAWYYALAGNHRAGDRARDGACYDVRDDTRDQLYRPETARPTQKQLDALAATWSLSLRKRGRFILTGYRNGGDVDCARDADGWRLYQQSVVSCAFRGWSRRQIQRRYYAPNLEEVWELAPLPDARGDGGATSRARGSARASGLDRRAPVVLLPRLDVRRGATLDSAAGLLRWAAADAGSGLAGTQVQRRVGRGPWVDVATTHGARRQVRVKLGRAAVQYRVRVRDRAGNVSGWAAVSANAWLRQERTARVRGAWRVVHDADASGGTLRRAGRSGTRLKVSFTGRAIGIVAPTGPGKGVLRIRMGGETVATIDLGRLPADDQRVVWTRSWFGARERRLDLVVGRVPGREHVDVDAFVVVH